MKMKTLVISCLIVLLLAVTVGLLAYNHLPYWMISWRLTPKTDYSKEYSDTAFSRITNGMARTNILSLLGTPLRSFAADNITFLVYSDIGHYTSVWEKAYYQRWLAVGKNDDVVYIFNRTITTEQDPCWPVCSWQAGPNGGRIAKVTETYANK